MKIVHIITGLGTGGAEMMLYKLLSAMDRQRFEQTVIALTDAHSVGDKIAALGITVIYLGMRNGRPDWRTLSRLYRMLRDIRPDAVQTWMYHADFLGGIVARLAGIKKVVWNIRHSDLPARHCKRSTRWVAQCCAWLSYWIPVRIVCNSQRAVAVHTQLGYNAKLLKVVGNGFDLQTMRPDSQAKAKLCMELGIGRNSPLVGLVARFDVQKNHQGFIAALPKIMAAHPSAHFVLAGRAVDHANPELRHWVEASGCASQIHLLGERDDIPELTAAFDVAVSASIFGEGFPNSVGEAMACAVPCVVTDVGDSAALVADTGLVVVAGDPQALADAVVRLLQMPNEARAEMGKRARQRIADNYSLQQVARQYEGLYLSL